MPAPSLSSIQIAQAACTMAGLDKISTFEDQNEVARALNDMYEDVIEDCLTIHPWRFATDQLPLARLANLPLFPGYSALYQLPTDPRPLQVRTIYVNGSLASRYKIFKNTVAIDATATNTVELEALWRLGEASWPPWFRLYAQIRVAGFICGSITRNGDLAASLFEEAEKQLSRARNRDSVQQTTQRFRMTKVRSSRMGGRPL